MIGILPVLNITEKTKLIFLYKSCIYFTPIFFYFIIEVEEHLQLNPSDKQTIWCINILYSCCIKLWEKTELFPSRIIIVDLIMRRFAPVFAPNKTSRQIITSNRRSRMIMAVRWFRYWKYEVLSTQAWKDPKYGIEWPKVSLNDSIHF